MLTQTCYVPIRKWRSETVTLQMPHDELLRSYGLNLERGCIM